MIEISRAAEADIRSAYQWYLDANTKAAGRFRDRLLHIFDLIEERPALFAWVSPRLRRARLGSYPYDVFFMTGDNDRPRVIAVLHERRDPSALMGRL